MIDDLTIFLFQMNLKKLILPVCRKKDFSRIDWRQKDIRYTRLNNHYKIILYNTT